MQGQFFPTSSQKLRSPRETPVKPMWKSFLTSIGLLAIALASALYSSAAARTGGVVSAGISALLALSIAIWVGVQFVPKLASGMAWDWLPFVSHYQVTREGWMFVVGVTIVVFAAINTANNLLYMVLSALLAVLVLSGFLSALNFRFLQIVVQIPARCYAGESFPITINIHNQKHLFPTFSMFFGPAKESPFQFSMFYTPVIRGRQEISQPGRAVLSKRGRYTFRELKASSRHPFGFFLKDRRCLTKAQCICYPEILPQGQIDFAAVDVRGTKQRFDRGSGSDLYTIRDYVPSDSARHVHWKASAKTAVLKTREYAAEEMHQVVLAFDRFGVSADGERFEHLVSYAASAAYYLINDGIEVKFVTDEWEGESLETILEYLALVEMSDSAAMPRASGGAMNLSLRA